MNIVIVGCGRVGSRLAMRLAIQGHSITILDENREAFLRLGTSFPGLTIQGSGLEVAVLERSHTDQAEIVLALTGGDNRNLMVAQLARHKFGVQRVVARLHDPIRAAKFHEMGVETLCTTTVLEGLLEVYVKDGAFPTLPGEMPVFGDASALDTL